MDYFGKALRVIDTIEGINWVLLEEYQNAIHEPNDVDMVDPYTRVDTHRAALFVNMGIC